MSENFNSQDVFQPAAPVEQINDQKPKNDRTLWIILAAILVMMVMCCCCLVGLAAIVFAA